MMGLKEHQAVLIELLREFDRVCKKHDIKYILFAGTALGAVRHGGIIPWDDDLDIAMLREEYEKLTSLPADEWDGKYYLQREFSEHWPMFFSKLRKNNTTCLEKYHPKDNDIHQGIYVDIFPVDNAAGNRLIRMIQFASSKVVLAKALYRRGYETRSRGKKLFMQLCRILPMKPFCAITKRRRASGSEYVHSFFGATSSFKKGVYPRRWFSDITEMQFEDMLVPVSAHYDELLTTLYGDYMKIPDEEDRKCKVHAILVDTERPYTEYLNYRDGMTFEVFTRSIR